MVQHGARAGDTPRHAGLRRRMVQGIRNKGITDERVLEAMNRVPRHLFGFESAFVERAYEDSAFPIGEGQTISQPFTVAYQTQLLCLEPGHKVLEIGTGSGYQAAVLCEMGARVFTIERVRALYFKVKERLAQLGYHTIRCFYGDGFDGLPAFAPFDRILITAAAPTVPDKLLHQLKNGGMLVVPLGKGSLQIMRRYTYYSDAEIKEEVFDSFRFVPMLPGKQG
ncbi:MAG: protein-L-isoaspartate(D-aspartate) O-methyltransferase [Chitinophagales bacterium]|nr:protein-L-isoaspartate(D-aspartate) O-methyltransferase [Chitinophagales bacterium]MDW8392823.1 protein-L-isoaspartate(D-aspartate) O-methyltransferase [Chitinophagales bacterium]